ncbi:MAG: hypothetical protein GY806_01165, partial [Gammaproteobacteria bacterium]|nr:hypothetical protein [Gammaproteobacteria bacterium]
MHNNTPGSVSTYISGIRDLLPSVDTLLSRHESVKLRDFVKQLDQQKLSGFQCNQDFITEIANYTSETLGSELGKAIFEDLQEMPQVLTANHHGIDTFAQSTQSNLLFSMRKRGNGKPLKTVPVLACGSVPLNNLTYPRGLLIYSGAEVNGDGGICKLPLFPDSYKRKLVSVAGPFTTEMLDRSRARAKKLIDDGKLAHSIESTLNAVFDDFTNVGQEFPAYSRQATVVNHRFWQRLFRDKSCRSELVYIELENIVGRLLGKDLFDKSTICYQLMFDPELRQRLIENLDGQRGCWQYEKLLQRGSESAIAGGPNVTDLSHGTMFFWGIDIKGKKIPLCVTEVQKGKGFELRGADDSGRLWTIPFTATSITQGLQDGRLLPSIFISYLLVSIARGISCIGGYYQADYLPLMRKGVLETLHSKSRETVETNGINNISSDLYLSGMQTIGLETDGQLLPAGPLEIIASGGLDASQ